MELIQTIDVGVGGSASITFSSIPQTYTDLYLVLSARTTTGAGLDTPYLTINSVSCAGYRLEGSGGSGAAKGYSSSNQSVGYVNGSGSTSNCFSNASILISNYTLSATKLVTMETAMEQNSSAAYSVLVGAICSNTSPATTVSITGGGGNFMQYTTASLYGILKGSGGATVS